MQGAVPSDAELDSKYAAWAVANGKGELLAANSLEAERKRGTFKANYARVLDFNNVHAESHGWWMGVEGPWMDLNAEEFKSQLTLQEPEERTGQDFTYSDVEAPKSVDWRKKGVVTEVKNQGMCGSCWSFSTTGSIEGLYAQKTGELRSFSEQELVDCDQYDMGCNGGLMDNAFKWVQEHGITDEKSYAYSGTRGKCSASKEAMNPYMISGHADVPKGKEKALQQAISQQPVSVGVDATLWQFYFGGVFNGVLGHCGGQLDHGVLAVGYKLAGAGKKSYYIVKNSWGKMWGEKGYIRVRANHGKEGMCAIAKFASYPLDQQ